jgi:hypothetical protein
MCVLPAFTCWLEEPDCGPAFLDAAACFLLGAAFFRPRFPPIFDAFAVVEDRRTLRIVFLRAWGASW